MMKKGVSLFLIVTLLGAVSAVYFTKKQVEKVAKEFPQNLEQFYNLKNPHISPGESTFKNVSLNVTAGYLNVNKTSPSALFYLFYECRSLGSTLNQNTDPLKVPILIWLQGGPGSSSMIGNYAEMGPETIEFNSTSGKYYTQRRNVSWNDFYHILFIEQPIGTGFSYLNSPDEVPNNQTGVSQYFLTALLNFYQLPVFSNLSQTPLYIFGESMAGHYIPHIARTIVDYNKGAVQKIPFVGIGIGDGLTDPTNQLLTYGLFGFSMALLDNTEREKVEELTMNFYYNAIQANKLLKQSGLDAALPFFDIAGTALNTILEFIPSVAGNFNVYNFRVFGDYDLSNIDKYLNSSAIKDAWGVPANMSYSTSSKVVYDALSRWDMWVSYADDVAYVLDYIKVLIYNGQDDMLVNSAGALEWINKLQWPGNSDFYNADHQNWLLNDNKTHAGYAQSARSLTFVLVNKAGHLAPMDQIEATTEMVRRFVEGAQNWTNNTAPTLNRIDLDEPMRLFQVPSKKYFEKKRQLALQSDEVQTIIASDL